MRKSNFPLLLILTPVIAFFGAGILGLIVAVTGLSVAYYISLRLHPRIRHTGWRSCKGTGEHRGAIFTWTFRKCPGCAGGRLIRFGAGHGGAGHIRSEYARGRAARKRAKKLHIWR